MREDKEENRRVPYARGDKRPKTELSVTSTYDLPDHSVHGGQNNHSCEG
jgi:hypothetical protein